MITLYITRSSARTEVKGEMLRKKIIAANACRFILKYDFKGNYLKINMALFFRKSTWLTYLLNCFWLCLARFPSDVKTKTDITAAYCQKPAV